MDTINSDAAMTSAGEVCIRLEMSGHGWAKLHLTHGAVTAVIMLSYAFDPFGDLVEWAKKIDSGELPAELEIDEEGECVVLVISSTDAERVLLRAVRVHENKTTLLEGIATRSVLAADLKAELHRFFSAEFDPHLWACAGSSSNAAGDKARVLKEIKTWTTVASVAIEGGPDQRAILTVMPDYGMSPFLWSRTFGDRNGGVGLNCCDAFDRCGDHPMSEDLWMGLRRWVVEFTYAPESHMDGAWVGLAFDWPRFHERGLELARQLKREVGNEFRVAYAKPTEDVAGRAGPEDCWEVLEDGSLLALPSAQLRRQNGWYPELNPGVDCSVHNRLADGSLRSSDV